MNKTNRLVSVVIPTHYRNDQLREAVESVQRQEYSPVEIIVVDDSGEGYASPVKAEYDIRFIEFDENKGAQAARTAGIENAEGQYINLLDDDDQMRSDKLQKQVAVIEENENVGVVYCGKEWENGHKVLPNPDIRGEVLDYALMFRMTPSSPSAMLIRSEVIKDILPLSDRPGGDDLGMKIELAKRTEFDFVDESLLFQGESADSRGGSIGAVTGRRQILDEYADLYDEHPSYVRRYAEAHTYLLEANILLSDQEWSWPAIKAAFKAAYYIPGFSLPFVGYLVASLFGQQGIWLAWKIYDRFFLSDEHRGKMT